jgi:2-dehydro-3-deoxygalactonokinase
MTGTRIYGDWGTTRLRLWLVENGAVVEFRHGPGIGKLSGTPAETLRAAIMPWMRERAPSEIRLCGMAGSRNGMSETPYADCPVDAARWRQEAADLGLDSLPLRIAAGVACRDDQGRPDVMRGEETQIFGAMRLRPEINAGRHVMILPGTHSKWVKVEDGRITSFRTFLTGEVFAVLQGSSLLTAGRDGGGDSVQDGFSEGLSRGAETGGVLGSLFEARAAQLRDGRSAGWASEFISGLLLGGELAEMARIEQLPRDVIVVGGADLAERYARALAASDVRATPLDGDACALAGLELLDADD